MAVSYEARVYHGGATMVDHTPAGDISAGTVVVVGNTPRPAHTDLVTGRLGALAAFGAVYAMIADGALADGVIVYWDDTAKKVSATATSNLVFGYTVSASAADGDTIYVAHMPNGAAAT